MPRRQRPPITNLANLSRQSRLTDHGRRLLRPPKGELPPPVRTGHPVTRATSPGPCRRHGASDCGMDRPAAPRGVPRQRHPTVSRPRSRHCFYRRRRHAGGMYIRQVCTAAHSPWQNGYAERIIGSIRRECLDHVIVLTESGLRRILIRYKVYYQSARTSRSRRTPRSRGPSPPSDRSSPCRRSAGCITAPTDAPPSKPAPTSLGVTLDVFLRNTTHHHDNVRVTLSRTEISPRQRLMPSDSVTSRRVFQWCRRAD
jgi:hypothetical protein